MNGELTSKWDAGTLLASDTLSSFLHAASFSIMFISHQSELELA